MLPHLLLNLGILLLLFSCLATSELVADESSNTSEEGSGSDESKTTAKTTTTTTLAPSTDDKVQNVAIFGCKWPDDFVQRFQYCVQKSGLNFGEKLTEKDVKYGVLDRKIMDHVMSECNDNNLDECVKKLNSEDLDRFVDEWQSSIENYTSFENCIQENTEAMNRLCGKDSDVSRVVSGAAGLHLNLLGVLVRVEQQMTKTDMNISQNCLRKVAEAVHITAALYIKSKHYKDNSVFCWNVVRSNCDSQCAAYAAELNCLHAECLDIPFTVMQEFGIWQWYFLDSRTARQKCAIADDKCTVTNEGPASKKKGMSKLFSMAYIKKKYKEMKVILEKKFDLPFHIILGIFVGLIVTFFSCVTILCMCWYGVIGKKRRKTRYSRLLGDGLNEKDASSSLTNHKDDDDDIDF